MSTSDAAEIAHWTYPPPYDFYNMEATEEAINELISGTYSSVATEEGKLIGFYCVGESAQVPAGHAVGAYQTGGKRTIDIGLGLRPDLTGRGLGSQWPF